MPRINGLTTKQKIVSRADYLKGWYKGKLAENGITQKDIANYIGVSPTAIHGHLSNGCVSLQMMIALCTLGNIPEDEIKRVLTL